MIRGSVRRQALWHSVFWLAVGVAAYVLGVQSAVGQRAEESVLDAAAFTTNPPPPLNLVTPTNLLITFGAIGLVTWIAHGWRRAIGVTAVSAVAMVASQLLKFRVLERPELLELDAPNTFPSGHMTTFTVVVAAAIWAVPAGVRALTTLGGAALLAVVAWQILAYGWHRPSDVFGGLALGILAFSLATFLVPLTQGKRVALGRAVSWGLIMSAFAFVAGALILVAVSIAGDNAQLMLTAGQLGTFAACALTARTALQLANPRR